MPPAPGVGGRESAVSPWFELSEFVSMAHAAMVPRAETTGHNSARERVAD